MQFPESWLREFCNPPISTEQLADLLTMAGLEVEEMRPVAPPFSGIVVAEILEAMQHPNADKLRVCKVDAGALSPNGPLQIVCGAPNARAGIRVPLAMVGAELAPGEDGKPFKIGVGKLRGVESFGMLCSARELKLSEDHGGLLELPLDTPVGTNIRDALKLDDTLFTLKLTPNLAHNLSVLGIAREVSALTGTPLNAPVFTPVKPTHDDRVPVRIEATDLCGRWDGRVIHGVDQKAATPAWMVERLARCGQRSVSALVDISNYVMFELGRPSHIFDRDKIHDELVIRWARTGETLKLLNGNTVTLDETVGVVADKAGPESLAGIMGGDATAVSLETQNIYLEAAFWWPQAIQGRARRFNFSTDAGHRFERGVDFATTVEHIERITALLIDICGTPQTQVGPIDDQSVNLPKRDPVKVRTARAIKVIGVPLSDSQIADIFTRLGLAFTQENGVFSVTPPSYRFDIEIEEDLIEEIARVYGFENIPALPPVAPNAMYIAPENQRSLFTIRRQLADLDYQEVINFSFVEEAWEADFAGNLEPIRLLNPIASQMSVMRSSLIASLVANVKYNLNRKLNRVRIFETGAVYTRNQEVQNGPLAVAGFEQPKRIAGLAYGPQADEQWGQASRTVDFFDVKADLEALFAPAILRFAKLEHPALHPGRSAQVLLGDVAVGFIGELHPRLQQKHELPLAPVLFEVDALALQQRQVPAYVEISKFPAVVRDLAVVVKQAVYAQDLLDVFAAEQQGNPACRILQAIVLFDEYHGKGLENDEKSLAFRFTLQDTENTLQDDTVEAAMSALIAAVSKVPTARLRA